MRDYYIAVTALLCLLVTMVTVSTGSISANTTTYLSVCNNSQALEMRSICNSIEESTLKLFGENFGVQYLLSKVASRVFVNSIVTKCKPGEYCVHLKDMEPTELEDRLLISWADSNVRRNLCGLRPCLSDLPTCGNPVLDMTLQSIALLCDLTQPGSGTYCMQGGLDLLQYAFADLHRNPHETTEFVCDCASKNTTCVSTCREIVYKFHCLSTQCQPLQQSDIAKFPHWKWFFLNQKKLMDQYNVTFCEKPIETNQGHQNNKGPVIYAFFPTYATSNVLAIVVTVVLLSSILMVSVTCLCWKRIFLPKYSRDRVQYTEVKGAA